jgi:hypothetical protein
LTDVVEKKQEKFEAVEETRMAEVGIKPVEATA